MKGVGEGDVAAAGSCGPASEHQSDARCSCSDLIGAPSSDCEVREMIVRC